MEEACGQLETAISEGDEKQVATILAEQPDILARFSHYHTNELSPLHVALNKDRTATARMLLKQDKALVQQMIHHRDFRGESPLHRCGWCGNPTIARKLISLGADINACNNLGLTPLHLAAERGHLSMVKLLLKRGVNVNASSNRGNTPLHRAAKEGHQEVIALLTKKGADPNRLNKSGFKALPSTTSESVQNQAKRSGKRGSLLKAGSKAGGSGQVERRVSNAGLGAKKREGKAGGSRTAANGTDETRYQVEEARLKGIDSDYYEILPDDISTGKKLGEGGFGTVYEGSCSGQPVALKKLTSTKVTVHSSFRSELSMLCKLRHPNIVLLLGAIIQPDQLCLVMELCQGGPLNRLLKQRRLSIKEVAMLAKQIAMAMNWLHSRSPPILHLDIKPGNILLTDNHSLQVKVSDFGLARTAKSKSGAVVGTRRYMAPEMMQRQPINEKADIYSYGVLLWQILTRKRPFAQFSGIKTSQEKKAFCDHVSAGNRPDIPLSAPPILAKLINRCWATDPLKRPSFQVVVETLEQVVLASQFDDDAAHNFWLLRAPTSCYDTLGMDWKPMRALLQETVPKSSMEPDWDVIKAALCSTENTEFVAMETFSAVANCFAPFHPPHKWLLRVQEAATAKYTTTAQPPVDPRSRSGSRIARTSSSTGALAVGVETDGSLRGSGMDVEVYTLGDSTKGALGSTAEASGAQQSGEADEAAAAVTESGGSGGGGGAAKAADAEEDEAVAKEGGDEDCDLVYYPRTTSSKAYTMLQGKTPGTFLLRSAPKGVNRHIPFSVSFVASNGAICHARVHHDVNKRVFFIGDIASAAQESIIHFLLSSRVKSALGLRCAVSSSDASLAYLSD
mmetsp:Transcript_8588/g.35801  ORF Transcript_8588/g.35801 Transcript_8588/m.35801 type:complete len:850 (+) Transcript_8588:147-2696(+)